MKLLILSVSILIYCIATTSAAASVWYSRDPDHPGKCVFKNQNLILSPGEKIYGMNSCSVAMCEEGAIAKTFSCGLLYAPEGCKIKEPLDASSTYPDCCSTGIICNDIPKE